MFGRLAAMEREHLATLERRYHVHASDLVPDGAVRRAVLQVGELDVPDDPVELLRLAVWLERRAEHFFSSHVDTAPPAAQRLYRELAAEETEHVDLLTTELRARAAGRVGLL